MKNISFKVTLLIVLVWINITAYAQKVNTAPVLQTGVWRGVLNRPDGHQIVFNFTTLKQKNKLVWYVQNAGERLLVDSIVQKGDSLWVQMPFFASRFALKIKEGGNLEGNFIKSYGNWQMVIPFTAIFGDATRYPAVTKPLYNLSGRWAVSFEGKNNLSRKAVGEFKQREDGTITGTFLTPTGDYRYLEGITNADSVQLSTFDGGYAFLFTAKLENDSTISQAVFYIGLSDKQRWTAVKDEHAALPDGYEATRLRPGETQLNFTFKDTNGKDVSINDDRYKNKVVIVQILGSWCPNCLDETAFLSNFYKHNKQRGIEVIGLAYEVSEDFNKSKDALKPFQKKLDVQYPFLITGVTVFDEKKTEKTLPQIDNIRAFPTTIFIDKHGQVARIHTGYSGPATGVHYEEFKKEFNEVISSLLSQHN